jgi:small-conductance mechanosensitive channel
LTKVALPPVFTSGDLTALLHGALWAVVILAATLLAGRVAPQRLRSALGRGGVSIVAALLLTRFVQIAIWMVGILWALSALGFGLSPLAAFIGVAGLAVSLSLQTVLQNVVAGVYLLAEAPFRIGDTVAVVGPTGLNHEGIVEDIQVRTTHLRSRDGELILVPNASVFSGVVTNRTAVGGFVTQVTVTFPRAADPDAVRRRVLPLLEGLPSVLSSPAPLLEVAAMGVDDWTARLSFWARARDTVSDAVLAIGRAFPEAKVEAGSGA